MRILSAAAMLALMATLQTASAKVKSEPSQPGPNLATSRVHTAEETAALSNAARERNEARQRAWDVRMKSITRGVCSGC